VRRRLFNLAAAVSLVLCAAAAITWASLWLAAPKYFTGRCHVGGRSFVIGAFASHLWLSTYPDGGGIWQFDVGAEWFAAGRGSIRNPQAPAYYLQVHWALLIIGFVLLPALRATMWLRQRRRTRAGCCPRCGYDLRATPDRCPECGTREMMNAE
jgi:hypothetical protein